MKLKKGRGERRVREKEGMNMGNVSPERAGRGGGRSRRTCIHTLSNLTPPPFPPSTPAIKVKVRRKGGVRGGRH